MVGLLSIFRRNHTNIKIFKQLRQRHYFKNMDSELLKPPHHVYGMQTLEREAFRKEVQIPRLRVPEEQLHKVLPLVKNVLLKMEQLRPVQNLLNESKDNNNLFKEILLHPLPVKSWDSLPIEQLEENQITSSDFYFKELELNYKNWRADEILKCVLPTNEDGLTSYSRIGHIVHINLREHLLPYKKLIGEVLCDKVPNCRTVVNKAATIDNTYRNFAFELISGVPEYQVETKENGITFEFDFSNVYWNPRLCTEHERIVQLLKSGDVLYDVFAGVGPFSVPAAKKRCIVLANDLNPESYRWLQNNMKRNKCTNQAKLYNKDGRDFILEDIKADLLKRWLEVDSNSPSDTAIHITMNLPAMAVEFLDAFRGLFAAEATDLNFTNKTYNYPTVHVYTFTKGEDTKSLVKPLVEQHLGLSLDNNSLDIHFVRNVAPNKDMYRASFRLTPEMLTKSLTELDTESNNALLNSRKRAASDGTTELNTSLQTAKVKCS
ncbi:tRNA (guanine(37)-N1)-methyltransferase-like [Teleopsis dalmanni]|uniref:tRNA (guanine(37)-N1)-methyltransferase-like n=1 Tax=Teleopsis dalmanni TaxID=139649 RepID=UPI0018CD9A9B|nr:tRNA (guanine(37)-N1)-methyltransferase-like [Teleopsis dalmanni]